MKQIESERIVNLAEFEKLSREARAYALNLRSCLKNGNEENALYLAEKLDIKLHHMEVFDFVVERRTINQGFGGIRKDVGRLEPEELHKLCRPIADWLEEKGDPYTTVEITADHIRVKQEIMGIPVEKA